MSDVLADEMTGGKILVFAHHRNVLDALEQSVVRTGRVEYIRIDGRTKVSKCGCVAVLLDSTLPACCPRASEVAASRF